MKARIKPTEKPLKLVEYLKPRLEKVKNQGREEIVVETEDTEKLGRIPGIDKYTVKGEEKEGIGGIPIHREAFTTVENRLDAAKAFLATLKGYTLYISTERNWDLRMLKKYNSEIVQTERKVAKELGIKSLDENFDLTEEELAAVYTEFLTE